MTTLSLITGDTRFYFLFNTDDVAAVQTTDLVSLSLAKVSLISLLLGVRMRLTLGDEVLCDRRLGHHHHQQHQQAAGAAARVR